MKDAAGAACISHGLLAIFPQISYTKDICAGNRTDEELTSQQSGGEQYEMGTKCTEGCALCAGRTAEDHKYH